MPNPPSPLKVSLIGYGKMGKMVEKAALSRNHLIVDVLEADVCIDFTHPDAAVENIYRLAEQRKNIIMGTTGWYERLPEVEALVKKYQIGLLYSPNFSLGVNLFLRIVEEAAKRLLPFNYHVAGVEWHHKEKVDSPSGTALAIAKRTGVPVDFASVRCGSIPGKHELLFDSKVDQITLTHEARSREGFAMGAVQAAEWLQGKTGLYTMEDMFK